MHRFTPFTLLREGWRTIRHAWVSITLTMLAFQLLLLIVVSPLIGWLFREALRANGMVALDFTTMRLTGGIGISLALILVILLLAFWIAAVQFIVLVVMLRRAKDRQALSFQTVWRDALGTARKLLRPSSFPLFFYLFFIVPLSGFGFASTLSQGISVPTFISGELMKSPTTATIWFGFILLLALLNLRFALALPIFVLTQATGGKSLRQSWRLTRGWAAVWLAVAVFVVLFLAGIASLALVLVAIVPTAITDEIWPAGSPAIAALSLGVAQVVGMWLTAFVLSVLGAVLLALVSQREDQLAGGLSISRGGADPLHTGSSDPDGAGADGAGPEAARLDVAGLKEAGLDGADTEVAGTEVASTDGRHVRSARGARGARLAVIASLSAIAIGFGFFHLGTMHQLSQYPDTLVLGHRGFSDEGAENTIEGLEAAAAANADAVEIDVMQTADKKFVVMHDAGLSRLTGQSLNVKDLTFDELIQITVRDQFGHEGKIPSLEAYILRAKELEMPLLIEIKSGGLDTPDRVDLLVDELAALDAIESNIFHALDLPNVERLKQLRPDATVGYILAIAGIDIPATNADFVVVEQWSATQDMQDAAGRAGYGFFGWTINEESHMRELLRRNVDGIITDHPDLALAVRDEMQEETGLAGTLIDALTRFVVVF